MKSQIVGSVLAEFPSPVEQYVETANPDYPTISIRSGQQFQYFGKVIGVVRKMG